MEVLQKVTYEKVIYNI